MEEEDGGVAIGKCCSSGVSYRNTLLRNGIGQSLRQGEEMWLRIQVIALLPTRNGLKMFWNNFFSKVHQH